MLAVGKLRVLPIPLPLITVPEIIKLYPRKVFAVFTSPVFNACLILVELMVTSSIS